MVTLYGTFELTINAKGHTYKIKNVWAKNNAGDSQKPFTSMLPSHDVIMLRLSK